MVGKCHNIHLLQNPGVSIPDLDHTSFFLCLFIYLCFLASSLCQGSYTGGGKRNSSRKKKPLCVSARGRATGRGLCPSGVQNVVCASELFLGSFNFFVLLDHNTRFAPTTRTLPRRCWLSL